MVVHERGVRCFVAAIDRIETCPGDPSASVARCDWIRLQKTCVVRIFSSNSTSFGRFCVGIACMRTVVEHMGIYTYIDKSAGSACLTTQSCATSSLATRLSAKTAGDDVVGSAGDRCVAGGEGCPMAGSTADRYRCRSGATRSTSLFSMVSRSRNDPRR